jgi:hypothetical protein
VSFAKASKIVLRRIDFSLTGTPGHVSITLADKIFVLVRSNQQEAALPCR